jgi:hypothetical protein
MGQNLSTWQLVEQPVVVPHPFGLFSIAEPRLTTDEHWRLGVQWQSQACLEDYITYGPCITDGTNELTSNSACVVKQYDPFTVYAYNTDPIPGHSLAEHRDQTVQRLINGEQLAAERKLWADMIASPDATIDASAYTPTYALAVAEHAIAEAYPGTGIIHMSRQTATILWANLVVSGGKMQTLLGTPVVIGAGYDNAVGAPTATSSIFATGPVLLYRGDIDTREQAINKAHNEVSYVAQRDYVLGWDCYAVQVDLTLDRPLS